MLTIASAIISSFKGKKLIDSLLFFGDFDFRGEIKHGNSEFLDLEFIDIPKGYKLASNLQNKGINNKFFTHISNITEIDQFFKIIMIEMLSIYLISFENIRYYLF